MKWTLLLALVSIGLVAGDFGAWKENYEYKYKLVQKTFVKLPGVSERGMVGSVYLTIRPQADNAWIGQITEKVLINLGEQDYDYGSSDISEKKSNLQDFDVPLNKLFKVYYKNGAIDTISVDQTMTEDQINLVKLIVNSFQVDTKGQNWIRESADSRRPDMDTNNAYYMTMEPSTVGVCKTSYDISRLPEYLAYAQYDTIPSLSKYAGEGDVIQIIKNMNANKCNNEQSAYFVDRDANGDADRDTNLYADRDTIRGADRDTHLYADRDNNRDADRDNNRYADRDNNRYADRDNNRYDVREINRNADRDTNRYAGDALDKVNGWTNTRIIISGSLDKYTLHSSVSTFTNEKTRNYFYLTLESMERLNNEDRSYRFSPRFEMVDKYGSMENIRSMENIGSMEKDRNMQNDGNMKNVGNLVQHKVLNA